MYINGFGSGYGRCDRAGLRMGPATVAESGDPGTFEVSALAVATRSTSAVSAPVEPPDRKAHGRSAAEIMAGSGRDEKRPWLEPRGQSGLFASDGPATTRFA